MAENQANAKQHPETELLVLENYSQLHPLYHPKIMVHILKVGKITSVCIHIVMRLIVIKMKIKKEKDHLDTT